MNAPKRYPQHQRLIQTSSHWVQNSLVLLGTFAQKTVTSKGLRLDDDNMGAVIVALGLIPSPRAIPPPPHPLQLKGAEGRVQAVVDDLCLMIADGSLGIHLPSRADLVVPG